jgi:hypothetical protein
MFLNKGTKNFYYKPEFSRDIEGKAKPIVNKGHL